jgi:acyl-CoA thioester hydrolase
MRQASLVTANAADWRDPGLLEVGRGTVEQAGIDYNGHLNVAHYRAAFDLATDVLFAHLGLGAEDYNPRANATLMVVEDHTRYHAELRLGESYRILAQLVGHSAKTIRYLMFMENLDRGGLTATHEELALHVDLDTRRASPLPAEVLPTLEALQEAHGRLPRHPDLGRAVGQPARS